MILKRLADIVLSGLGLVITAPLLIAISLIVKLESTGPVLYRCKRVGRFGKAFEMFKFRTMLHNADSIDRRLCCHHDVRVTTFGKVLRRTKLNELPQLINVLRGDMSIVGPRPEDPKFVTNYQDKWQIVLQVKPGIFGPNQIVYRNEEDLLEQSHDPERLYTEKLLPKKLDVDVEYVLNRTVWRDAKLLARGVHATIFGSGKLLHIFAKRRLVLRIFEDSCAAVLAYFLAYYIRFETINLEHIFPNVLIILLLNPALFGSLGLYKRAVRFFSVSDLFLMVRAVLISGILLLVGNKIFLSSLGNSRTVALIYPLILICIMSATRLVRRLVREKREIGFSKSDHTSNVLIYGAGRLGVDTAKRLQFEPELNVLGFVDDDPNIQHLRILGLKVLGTGSDLQFLKTLYNVEKIFVAFKSPTAEQLVSVRRSCSEAGLTEVLIRSSVPRRTSAPFIVSESFRRARASDLLGMNEVPLNTGHLQSYLEGATVAVDGAGDKLGEQLCRELLRLNVGRLVLVDSCPRRLHRITRVAESVCHHSTLVHTHLIPDGFHHLYQHFLAQYDLTAIIFNRPSRPLINLASNGSALFLLHFVETVRRVEAVNQLGYRCLSYVSPFLKDSLSRQEKALHLLSEHYIRASCEAYPAPHARAGIVRLANVLESDCELFRNDYLTTCAADALTAPVRFTSARYAARIVLNSLPLYQNGETFVDSASQPYLPKTLIDHYHQIVTNDYDSTFSAKNSQLIAPYPSLEDEAVLSRCEKTIVSDVLALNNPEVPDIVGLQMMTERNNRYLDDADQTLIGEFISLLYRKFEPSSSNGLPLRYPLDAA
jgi:lipopolysaccharide/colanic/teichoic acid biosynthesis glycosyltransferase/NAD(P)-dependent dehydrogenase (short-subunit alcohol dehydrogenase family)